MTNSNNKTTFANKIKIIYELSENHRQNRWLNNSGNWFKVFELGITFAIALHTGAVIDSQSRYKRMMEEPFDALINHFGQDDIGFTSAEELLQAIGIDN